MEMTLSLTIDEFHHDVSTWKSNIALIKDEVIFIERLISSYVFEPRTPNLFEKLEQYKSKIGTINESLGTVQMVLKKHDAEISGMLECDTVACDSFFTEKHILVKKQYREFITIYNTVKQEIFTYCGSILKSNKKSRES